MPKVGQYCVDVKSFEEIALPTLEKSVSIHDLYFFDVTYYEGVPE